MFECFHCCKKAVIWDSDFDFSDFGLEGNGVVHVYHCMHCGARIYIFSGERDHGDGYGSRKRLIEDLDNMENVLIRTADRCDIWQDRLIHAMGRAIYDILVWILKHSNK